MLYYVNVMTIGIYLILPLSYLWSWLFFGNREILPTGESGGWYMEQQPV